MNRRRTSLVVGVVAMIAITGTAGAAQAVMPVQKPQHYSGSFTHTDTDCGLSLHLVTTFSGVASVRPAPGSDQAFLAHDNYQFTDIISLDDNDDTTTEFVRVEGNGNFLEQKAVNDPTNADPNVYVFSQVDAGTFRIYSSDGDVLLRGTGTRKITQTFDTLGDGQPGGVFVKETVIEHGNLTADFCAVLVAELT